MVKKFSIFWCSLLYVGSTLAQTVTNVRAEQVQSDIVVTYDLESKEPCTIEVYVSPDGGRTWQGPLSNISGDAGKNISAGAKKCRWFVLNERESFKGEGIKFKVVAVQQSLLADSKSKVANENKQRALDLYLQKQKRWQISKRVSFGLLLVDALAVFAFSQMASESYKSYQAASNTKDAAYYRDQTLKNDKMTYIGLSIAVVPATWYMVSLSKKNHYKRKAQEYEQNP
jgi:hypothetical protein